MLAGKRESLVWIGTRTLSVQVIAPWGS